LNLIDIIHLIRYGHRFVFYQPFINVTCKICYDKGVKKHNPNYFKLKEIEKNNPELRNKFVVISQGQLLKVCTTESYAQEWAFENIPDGQRGCVSQVGKNEERREYRI
jgi:hypothetical protein